MIYVILTFPVFFLNPLQGATFAYACALPIAGWTVGTACSSKAAARAVVYVGLVVVAIVGAVSVTFPSEFIHLIAPCSKERHVLARFVATAEGSVLSSLTTSLFVTGTYILLRNAIICCQVRLSDVCGCICSCTALWVWHSQCERLRVLLMEGAEKGAF
jgi:hypothetical protein